MITYAQYMAKEFTHAQYYNEFVTPELLDVVVNYMGADKIKNSMEERFSDIPLITWDRASETVLSVCSETLRKKDSPLTLSVSVCIAKTAARHIRGF